MANNEGNLIPNSERTPEQLREQTRKAGIASGEARRKKKLLRECLDELLAKEYDTPQGKVTGSEAISVKLMQKALKGDLKAFEILRDTAGEKPVERVMVADVDQATIDEVERMVKGDEQ